MRSLPHAPGVSGNHLAGLDRKQGLSKQPMHGNISLSSGHWSLFHVTVFAEHNPDKAQLVEGN